MFWIYRSIGRTDDALDSVSALGGSERQEFALGVSAFDLGDEAGVQQHLGAAVGEESQDAQTELYRIVLLAEAGLADAARRALKAFERSYPHDVGLPVAVGAVASASGDEERAKVVLDATLAKQIEAGGLGMFASSWMLADLLAAGGETEAGVEILERASLRRDDTYPSLEGAWLAVQVRLWRAYEVTGRAEEAAEAEAELRNLLSEADAGHWSLCILNGSERRCGVSRGLAVWLDRG